MQSNHKTNNRADVNLTDLATRLKEQGEHLKNTTATKNITVVTPKLFVSGKLDKSGTRYLSKNIYVSSNLCDEIKDHCKGLDQAVFNYLMYLGLNCVKEKLSPIFVDIKDIEQPIE